LLAVFHPISSVCDSCLGTLDQNDDLFTGLLLLAALIAALVWAESASPREILRQACIASVAGLVVWGAIL
jgi:hypothetical protein